MSRWHERGCTQPDVVVASGLPCCRFCYGVASLDDVQFDTSLRIRQAPVLEDNSTYNLRWPACVDYVDARPEVPPDASTSSSSGSTFPFGGTQSSQRTNHLLNRPGAPSKNVELDSKRARYEALSYTWADSSGDSTRCRPMFIGSYWDIIPITRNCENALRSIRLVGESFRSIWVDSLCINQDDTEERNAQVALMPQIYAAAIGVLAYLGPAADDSERALSAIFNSMSHRNCGHNGKQSQVCADCWMPIKKLLSRPYFRRLTVEEVSIGIAAYLTQKCGLGMAVLLFAGFINSGKFEANEYSLSNNVNFDMGSLSLRPLSPCDIRIISRSGYLEVTAIRVCNLRGFFTDDGRYRQSFVRLFENLDTGKVAKNMSFELFSLVDQKRLEERKECHIETFRLIVGGHHVQRMSELSAEPLLLKLAAYVSRHKSDSKASLWKIWKQLEVKLKPYLEDERGIQLLLCGITGAEPITLGSSQDGRPLQAFLYKGCMLRSSESLLTLLWSLLPKRRQCVNKAADAEKVPLSDEEILKGFQEWADISSDLLFAMSHSIEHEDESFFGIRSSVEMQKCWLKAFNRFEHKIMPQRTNVMGVMEAIAYVLRLFPPMEPNQEYTGPSSYIDKILDSQTKEIAWSHFTRDCLWDWEVVGSNFEKRWKILQHLGQHQWLASWRDEPTDKLDGLERQMSIRYRLNSFGFNLTLPSKITIQ
ncbi:heterokaryon incompatibility protein [Colletotrichum costaricense]|uniref:Heterokaryon incompatibility protein n=1 Tax=Colletotrichum costaricense TaxID=1209916 RepID=A0AAJ0DWY0_9PEZI|nr:heterokaryon incompatibility protein [Colletotrichum costaricense]KAK1517856.1 heterokaryon incompatibility protein [Colletotrichum costaricense]